MNLQIQNGWILSLISLGISYAPLFFSKKGATRLTNFKWMNKKGRYLSFAVLILYALMLIIPVFHSITNNFTQLTIGGIISIAGVAGVLISYHNYFTTEQDTLITKGLYRISRNPIYVFTLVAAIGASILCTAYEMAPVIIIYLFVQHPIIKEEERFCTETYGQDYLEYKKKTARYFLFF